MRFILSVSALALCIPATAADQKSAADFLRRGNINYMKGKFNDAIKDYTECLRLDPKNIDAIDGRGNAHFMAGKFAESVADFDAQLKLDPKLFTGHWRRGISLYYAGKYDEGKKQFEGYEKFDTNDVENAVWHFMCVAKKEGMKKARAGILKIGKDKRPEMMKVYEMFKATIKPGDLLKAVEEDKPDEKELARRLFYAHLYLGIYHDLAGDNKKAAEHLSLAAGKYRTGHYMGGVARVHHEVLTRKKDK